MATLFAREDAGLHMACVLGAYLVLAAIAERGVPARAADIAPFLAAAILYPAFVLLAQNALLPIGNNFGRIYSGVPPYAHLTAGLLTQRAHTLLQQPAPLLLLVASAAPFLLRPRWTALTGLLAAIPWFAVSVTAVSDIAGSLSAYYAFPFLILPIVPFVITAELPKPETVYVDHL
jgi:hypothetical protein